MAFDILDIDSILLAAHLVVNARGRAEVSILGNAIEDSSGILYGATDSLHSLRGTINRGCRMSINPGRAGDVARQLEVLWTSGTLSGVSDAQLLREFAESRSRGATSES